MRYTVLAAMLAAGCLISKQEICDKDPECSEEVPTRSGPDVIIITVTDGDADTDSDSDSDTDSDTDTDITDTVDTDVTDTDPPVDTDTDTDVPVDTDTSGPVDTSPVIDTSAPVDTGPVVDTSVPIDTGQPVDTSAPFDTGPVVDTAQPPPLDTAAPVDTGGAIVDSGDTGIQLSTVCLWPEAPVAGEVSWFVAVTNVDDFSHWTPSGVPFAVADASIQGCSQLVWNGGTMLIDAAWSGDCLDTGDTGASCDRLLIEDLSAIGQFGNVTALAQIEIDGVIMSLAGCFTTTNDINVDHYYVECPFPL